MHNCVCGVAIDGGDAVCAECGALRELGLAEGATLDEVKASYKMLVKVWHPDRFQGDQKLAQAAETKLKAINAAFSYLTGKGYRGGGGYKGGAGPRTGSGEGDGAGAAGPGARAEEARGTREPGQKWAGQGEPRGPAGARGTAVRQRRGAGFGRRVLVRIVVVVVAVGIGVFLFEIADSYVANDTRVGRYYVGFKSQVSSDFEAAWQRTFGDLKEGSQGAVGGSSGTASVAAPAANEPSATAETPASRTTSSAGAGAQAAIKKGEGPLQLRPYVTLGMTRDEVEEAQGAPTSTSDGKLMYGASELDLKDGHVVGWKIDARSQLRVKIWPEGPVDTSLRFFTNGSTKDEVLVVQGTPTSFTQDRFEYGSSVVYFREGRVVVWRSGSVRLRAE